MKTAEIDSADEDGGGVAIAYSKRKDRDDESRRRARFLATQSISNGDTLYCQEVNSNSSDMLPFNNTGALYSDSDDSLGLGLGSNRHRPREKREFNKGCTSSFCTSQSSSSFYESSSDEDESMHGIEVYSSDVSLTPHRSSFCNSLSSAVLPPVSFESESPDSSMDASFSFEEKDGEFTSKNSTIRAENLESLEALKASEAAKQKLIQAQFFRADKFYLDGSNLSFETPNDGTHHSNGQKSARTHVEPSHTHQNTDKNITSPQLVKLCIKGVKGIEKEEVSRFINGRCHDVEFTLDQPSMSGNVFLTVPKQYEERITREIDAVTFQGRVLRAKRAHPHNQPPHTPIQFPPLKRLKTKSPSSKPSSRFANQRPRLSSANEIGTKIDADPNDIESNSESLSDIDDYVNDEKRRINPHDIEASDNELPPLKKSKITASKPSPRNDEQKKSRMRLSWANEIAVDIDSAPNEIGVSDSDSLSDVEDYVDDEERQIKEKMKGGKPGIDAANFSYLVERNANSDSKRWESGGAQSTVEINPCDGKWSFIGRKSSRGRIVMKSSSYDPGPVIATGRRRTKPKLAKRRKEKIFLSSASMRSDKYAPSVIQQDRMTFTRTPKKKRRNDAKNGLKYMCEKLGDAVLPNQTPNTKKNIMLEAISGRKNDDDGNCSSSNLIKSMAATMRGQKGAKRRSSLAWFVEAKYSRKAAMNALGFHISEWEWRQAKFHSLTLGAGNPVKVQKFSRRCSKEEILEEVLSECSEEVFTRVAYGDLTYTPASGHPVQLDATYTTDSHANIIRDYCKKKNPKGFEATEGQCKKRHQETRQYCCKKDGHDGRCQFTMGNQISTQMLRKVLKNLTNGGIKSLAGLDDEATNRGSRNFEVLRKLYRILAVTTEESEEQQKTTLERIDRAELFHQTIFRIHLERNGQRSCQCISCALDSDDNQVPCEHRNCHGGPCHDCEQSFEVISYLKKLAKSAQEREGLTDERVETFVEIDCELDKCRENLMRWRTHILRKKVEGEFTRKQLNELKDDEVIVVSDFKMKLLPQYYRETQKEFFAKRGTACLGFLVYSNNPDGDGNNAHYLYFFSDDTTQDTDLICAGKAYVYHEFLPSLLPDIPLIKVLFESDGAAAFNSYKMKALQPFWKKFTDGKVEEIQIRFSISGDGKSPLDGSFGRIGRLLSDAVNNGEDFNDAESILRVYEGTIGIRNGAAFILSLDRSRTIRVEDQNMTRLFVESHRIVLDREKNRVLLYSNSGYGRGVEVCLDKFNNFFEDVDNLQCPAYSVTQETRADDTKEEVVHPTESFQQREKQKKMSKRLKAQKKFDDDFEAYVEEMKANGLWVCSSQTGVDKLRCKCWFFTEKGLQNHVRNNAHAYPKRNMMDHAAAFLAQDGGALAVGSRWNRNEAYSTTDDVRNGEGLGNAEGSEWHERGWGRKWKRASPKRLSQKLKDTLIDFFEMGERSDGEKSGRNKYTPKEARAKLSEMKEKTGLKTFSSTSEHGKLPSEEQIRSFWSRYKKNRNEKDKKSNEEWVAAALEEDEKNCIGDDPGVVKSGILKGKKFSLDSSLDVGKEVVRLSIEAAGGKVQKLTKSVDFLVYTNKPKKAIGPTNKKTKAASWDRLQRVINKEVTLEQLLSTEEEESFSVATRGSGIFSDLKFSIDKSLEKNREHVESKIIEFGGEARQRLTSTVDFLVYGNRHKAINEKNETTRAVKFASLTKLIEVDEAIPSLLRPLTLDEDNFVRDVVSSHGAGDDVVVSDGADCVKRESMHRLQPGERLNDEVINYYLKVCLRDYDEKFCSGRPGQKRCHFFCTYFFQELFDEKNTDLSLRGRYNYEAVRRWARRVPAEDIFNLECLFIPIHVGGNHWTAACVFMEEKKIQYYDSLGGTDQNKLKGLLQYLEDEWRDKRGGEMDTSEWKLAGTPKDIAKQSNGYDCGVFACLFATYVTRGCDPIFFSQNQMERCRKRIALAIMNSVESSVDE